MRLSALFALSRSVCLLSVPFRSAQAATMKAFTYAIHPPFACLSLRSIAPPRTALRFQATAWAQFFPHSTRGDTIRRESHRALIDAK